MHNDKEMAGAAGQQTLHASEAQYLSHGPRLQAWIMQTVTAAPCMAPTDGCFF